MHRVCSYKQEKKERLRQSQTNQKTLRHAYMLHAWRTATVVQPYNNVQWTDPVISWRTSGVEVPFVDIREFTNQLRAFKARASQGLPGPPRACLIVKMMGGFLSESR